MLYFEHTIDASADAIQYYFGGLEKLMLFDIETTGLSAGSSYVYLIGAMDFSSGKPTLRQWFLNDISEEKLLVKTFFEYAAGFSRWLHYNGATFDIPYLQKKAKRHCLLCNTEPEESIDMYKLLQPLKKWFSLPDLKQKTVERFLRLFREDPFSGGDLIPVYTEYLAKVRLEQLRGSSSTVPSSAFLETGLPLLNQTQSDVLLATLLLHNKEDLTGLFHISSLANTLSFLQGQYTVEPELSDSLSLRLLPVCPHALSVLPSLAAMEAKKIPEGIHICLIPDPTKAYWTLTVSPIASTLKYFFENYREYYYLPAEDKAIHKSVAEFVEPEYRKKATKETAYSKKAGTFLYQPSAIVSPYFKECVKDHHSFFPVEELSKLPADLLKQYTDAIMNLFL